MILGAIDISKRATRLKVAEVGTGDSVRLLERSSLVSAELSNCDRLSALLMAEIEAARDAGADHVEVVATRSLRGTRLLRLLDRVCRASGAGGILLPDPEQRLASTFLAATVPSAGELEGTVAVARVGESTTGIAVGAPGERPGWVGSRPVGCATLTEKARFSDPPRPNQIEAAVTAAVRKLETLSPPAADRVLLSTPLAAALERICGPRIDPASARRGLGSILGQTGDDIAAWFGTESGQGRLLPATIVCCLGLAEVLGTAVEPREADPVAGRFWLTEAGRTSTGSGRET